VQRSWLRFFCRRKKRSRSLLQQQRGLGEAQTHFAASSVVITSTRILQVVITSTEILQTIAAPLFDRSTGITPTSGAAWI